MKHDNDNDRPTIERIASKRGRDTTGQDRDRWARERRQARRTREGERTGQGSLFAW